jgi:DNA-binding transcriptional LysR family regulator
VVRTDEMVWMAQEKTLLEPDEPVPLVMYQSPSISRRLAIEALEAEGRTWRIGCNTREVNGVLTAVRAGLGLAVYPHTLIPEDLVKVSVRFALPTLGQVRFTLLSNPLAPAEPVAALTEAIMARSLV